MVKWVFSQAPELFQWCQRRGMCDKVATLGFISDGEESQEPYRDIFKTIFKMGWALMSV